MTWNGAATSLPMGVTNQEHVIIVHQHRRQVKGSILNLTVLNISPLQWAYEDEVNHDSWTFRAQGSIADPPQGGGIQNGSVQSFRTQWITPVLGGVDPTTVRRQRFEYRHGRTGYHGRGHSPSHYKNVQQSRWAPQKANNIAGPPKVPPEYSTYSFLESLSDNSM